MVTMDDWSNFLATGKVLDSQGKPATGAKRIGTQLELKPKPPATEYEPPEWRLPGVWVEDAKTPATSTAWWSLESDTVRLCMYCMDPIPDGSQAVYRWDGIDMGSDIAHPRCVDDWHEWLGPVRGGDSQPMSQLRSKFTREAKKSLAERPMQQQQMEMDA